MPFGDGCRIRDPGILLALGKQGCLSQSESQALTYTGEPVTSGHSGVRGLQGQQAFSFPGGKDSRMILGPGVNVGLAVASRFRGSSRARGSSLSCSAGVLLPSLPHSSPSAKSGSRSSR